MINRVLIRMKVVQMLYSYLLTRSEFKIETAPETASRDRRYGYCVYVDLLLLLLELSGYPAKGIDSKSPVEPIVKGTGLNTTKTARSLSQNEEVRALIAANGSRLHIYDNVLPRIVDAILKSAAYRDFSKIKGAQISDEVTMWRTVLNSIIGKDQELLAVFRTNPEFTVKGVEFGIKMLNDTLANYSDTRSLLFDAKRDLATSLDKAYELYHVLLWLIVELTRVQEQRLEAAKEKFLATDEERNPNTRFVDNKLAAAIAASPEMEEYFKQHPFSWENDMILLRDLMDKIQQSEIYTEYMNATSVSFADDCELWRKLMKNVILVSDDLLEALESRSIYWNDDLTVMGTFVLKTIKQYARDGERTKLLPQYKDDEDAAFGVELFGQAVRHREEYRALIDRYINTARWDSERLALMDIVIILTALTEIINFPAIPLAVSVNEYVEITHWYSSPRSGSFVNGLLAAATTALREEGKLLK